MILGYCGERRARVGGPNRGGRVRWGGEDRSTVIVHRDRSPRDRPGRARPGGRYVHPPVSPASRPGSGGVDGSLAVVLIGGSAQHARSSRSRVSSCSSIRTLNTRWRASPVSASSGRASRCSGASIPEAARERGGLRVAEPSHKKSGTAERCIAGSSAIASMARSEIRPASSGQVYLPATTARLVSIAESAYAPSTCGRLSRN